MNDFSALLSNLKELTSLIAQSGYEEPVINYIVEKITPFVKEIKVDNLGNVIARVNEIDEPDPFKVMVFAHMDELGFVVKKIEDNGFLRLERLGGIPEKSMAGQSIVIKTDKGVIHGVIGTKSHHVTKAEEKYRVLPVSEVYADFGFRSKEEAIEAGIYAGTPVSYARQFFNNGSIVFSNSIDNRAGCLTLMELIERMEGKELPSEVYIVFSVQEEFNLRGILPAVRKVDPDIAIAIDLIVAADTPDLMNTSDIELGKGPCINKFSFHGRGTLGGLIPNPKLVKHVLSVAKENNIPIQHGVFMGGLTDASFSQLENDGIPMIDLAFPARYSHAPIEAVDLKDIYQLIILLEKLVPTLNKGINLKKA